MARPGWRAGRPACWRGSRTPRRARSTTRRLVDEPVRRGPPRGDRGAGPTRGRGGRGARPTRYARAAMLFEDVARTSAEVARTSSRSRKVELLGGLLRSAGPAEVPVVVAYLSGALPHGPVGVGWASLRDLPPPASRATLGVREVDAALRRIGSLSGAGSQSARRRELADLFGRVTELERRFLIGLLTGEVRQGALEGVMVEAVARAPMLGADLGAVAAAVLAESERGLARFRLQVLEPVQPMLARTASDLAGAFGRIAPASIEWKLDGARIQVHRRGDRVRVFTRNLADATERVPEIVERVLALPVEAVVLDGEAIALRDDGRPRAFQVTMRRFGSRRGVEELRAEIPLSCFFFDALHLDGEDLID